jgi:hypothetical protein
MNGQEVCTLTYAQINNFCRQHYKNGMTTEELQQVYGFYAEYKTGGKALARIHFIDMGKLNLFLMMMQP